METKNCHNCAIAGVVCHRTSVEDIHCPIHITSEPFDRQTGRCKWCWDNVHPEYSQPPTLSDWEVSDFKINQVNNIVLAVNENSIEFNETGFYLNGKLIEEDKEIYKAYKNLLSNYDHSSREAALLAFIESKKVSEDRYLTTRDVLNYNKALEVIASHIKGNA